jgi:hypothetical protein
MLLALVGQIEMVSCGEHQRERASFMVAQLLKRRFLSASPESWYAQIISYVVALMAAFIFVSGVLLIADMDLTRAQMAVGFAIVVSMVLQCFTLFVLLQIARKLLSKAA